MRPDHKVVRRCFNNPTAVVFEMLQGKGAVLFTRVTCLHYTCGKPETSRACENVRSGYTNGRVQALHCMCTLATTSLHAGHCRLCVHVALPAALLFTHSLTIVQLRHYFGSDAVCLNQILWIAARAYTCRKQNETERTDRHTRLHDRIILDICVYSNSTATENEPWKTLQIQRNGPKPSEKMSPIISGPHA